MTTASTTHGATATLPSRIVAGVAGGLAGGIMFGILMQMMDMIGMVAMLVNSTSIAVGWLLHFKFNTTAWQSLMGHLVYGLLLGIVYAAVRPRLQRS